MEIKKRDMYLSGFHEGEKIYLSKEITFGNKTGVASILKFGNVENKTDVHYNFKDMTIVDNDYTWIQIALKDENFWVKAMYDKYNHLVEIYIDVTRQNIFNDMNNPSYEDMFLDIVIPAKGHIYSMDEVELMKAYRENVITEYEYKKARLIGKKIIFYFEKYQQEFLDLLTRLKYELEFQIEFDKEDEFTKVA